MRGGCGGFSSRPAALKDQSGTPVLLESRLKALRQKKLLDLEASEQARQAKIV